MRSFFKFLNELLPLVVFFIAYKSYGIMTATLAISIASVFSLAFSYQIEKKISIMPIISTMLLVGIAMISYFNDYPDLIKLKPTFINLLFALVLVAGIIKNKGLIKHIFGNAFNMQESDWILVSKRWVLFFICIAISNEFVWRNFSDDAWVNFKVFGLLPLTFIFAASQVPFMMKKSKELNENKNA